MQEVSGSIPLFSTKKALYFVGSMVLFFLLKLVFLGGLHCFACTVFGLLQAVELRTGDSARWSNLFFCGMVACKKS